MKVLNHFHYDDLWEIYAFILQVHEEVHLFQKGEPMLSEFLLSYLWCKFLDQHDFWFWQESEKNGKSFNREKNWVTKVNLTNHEIKLLFTDHLLGISNIFKSKFAYDLICESAWLFDHHQLKYKKYLDFIVWCFENRHNEYIVELSREKWGIIC
jgi:hypothetical protein